MLQRRFERLVGEALDSLPPEIAAQLQNVDVVVELYPAPRQLRAAGLRQGQTLFGLYEGVPRTARTGAYSMVLPDKITIFQAPIEACCRTDEAVRAQVRRTVIHEIAHHFGIDDEALQRLGY